MSEGAELVYDPSCLLYGGGFSFIASFFLFKYVGPSVSQSLWPPFKNLHQYVRADWQDRFLSNINAAVSIGLSGYCLMFDAGLYDDMIWYDSFPARLACGLMVGYMLADTVIMALWCKLSRGEMLGYIFHHAATVYAYYFISAYGVLCYFGMLRLIAEMSTPFVNQRWFFDTMDKPRTNATVLFNGIMMVASFLFFRMVTMPIYWYRIWLVSFTEAALKLGHIQLIMYIPCLVLDILNIFWFYKMVKGLVKALKNLGNNNTRKQKSV